jgi:hypothetical protein
MRLLMLLTLAAVVWSGQLPLTATPLTIGLLWAPATLLTIIAGSALCRGYQRIADTTHFELCTAQIFARALRCVVRPGRATFKVTPKEGVDLGGLAAIRQLSWVVAITALLAVGLVVRVLDEAGVPLVPNLPSGPAFWVVPLLGLFELRRLARTLTLVSRRRQRRIEYRMPLDARVVATNRDGVPVPGWTRDLCPSGLGLALAAPLAPGATVTATFQVPGLADVRTVSLDVVVQSCREDAGGWAVGTRVVGCDDAAERRIVEYCYVVSQVARLRGAELVALPAPALSEALEPEYAPAALAA